MGKYVIFRTSFTCLFVQVYKKMYFCQGNNWNIKML